jgi:hypothetical protein
LNYEDRNSGHEGGASFPGASAEGTGLTMIDVNPCAVAAKAGRMLGTRGCLYALLCCLVMLPFAVFSPRSPGFSAG